jgi:predicted dehydrogenase
MSAFTLKEGAIMSNAARMKVGIVGCGYQGTNMARACARSEGWQVTACADPNVAAAEKLAAEMLISSVYDSIDALLAKSEVDAVIVAVPHHLLCPITLTAIHAGKHVLCEKPVGIIEAEVAQMEKAASKAGVVVEAGYSFRRLPGWAMAKALIDAGTVGEITGVMGTFACEPLNEGWLSTPDTGGGPMLYLGSHLIDQILWCVNDTPVEVFAHITHRADTRADERTAFQIQYAGGATAQCLITQTSHTFDYALDVYGRAGRIRIAPAGFLDYAVSVVSKEISEYAEEKRLHTPNTDDPRFVMHVPQVEAFANAIRTGTQPAVTLAEARITLSVIDAVFKSAKAGAPVRLLTERSRNAAVATVNAGGI